MWLMSQEVVKPTSTSISLSKKSILSVAKRKKKQFTNKNKIKDIGCGWILNRQPTWINGIGSGQRAKPISSHFELRLILYCLNIYNSCTWNTDQSITSEMLQTYFPRCKKERKNLMSWPWSTVVFNAMKRSRWDGRYYWCSKSKWHACMFGSVGCKEDLMRGRWHYADIGLLIYHQGKSSHVGTVTTMQVTYQRRM